MRTRRWFPIAVSLTVLALFAAGSTTLAKNALRRQPLQPSAAGVAPSHACDRQSQAQPLEVLLAQDAQAPRCEGAPALDPLAIDAGSASANPHFRGTCRCSCGYPCQTDADCGGALCMKGITCC